MANNPLYLWNEPKDTTSDIQINSDRIDDLLTRPVTGEDIAYRVNKAQMEGVNPNLSFDEFKLYDEWHKKQEINWWQVATEGAGHFFHDIGSGLATLQPFGEGHSFKEMALNLGPRLAPTAVEAFGRGTRIMGGLIKEAANSGNSPLYRLFNPNGDMYTRYMDFNSLAEWNARTTRITEGKENVIMPDSMAEHSASLYGKTASDFSAQDWFRINTKLAEAGSYFLDPITLLTLGEGALFKAGGKGISIGMAESVAKAGLKEGITAAESVARNTSTRLEVASMRGASLTEKIGKSMRVAGEAVDKPISGVIDSIKKHASEFLDANIHDTPSANIKVTGATKGQGGFGGALMAGLGYATWSIPYASGIVPIWAVANAAKIGGAFVEAVGKEMVHGVGVLERLGIQQTSTGKLARTFNKWSPLSQYVWEMSKATLKSGAFGAGIGYLANGEEGAAGGLGVGMAIGTTHYHIGVANNMFKGRSREAMMNDLVNNIDTYRKNGFTQKADAVLKYLNDIRAQHGDDGFYRNLSTYLAFERDSEVALSVWYKEDFMRIRNDPATPADVRRAIDEVISQNDPANAGQGWNGLFWGRRGEKPYFLYKDGKSAKTHVIINAWALDNAGKTQATGMKGEFYHVLADAWKEASGKERFKEEIFDGLSRTLGTSNTPEGRKKMAEILRNAAGQLGVFNEGVNNQPSANSRAKNLLRLERKNSPAGWTVDHVAGNVTVNDKGVKRPLYSWESKNGWRVMETSDGRYNLTGTVEGKRVRYEARSLSEAVLKHKEIAPMDLQTSARTANIEPRRRKAKVKPIEGQVPTSTGPRLGETPEGRATLARASHEKVLDRIVRFMAEKQGVDFASESKKNPAGLQRTRDFVKRFLADGWIHDESRVTGKTNVDSTMAELGWFHPEYPNLTIEDSYRGTKNPAEPAQPATAGTPPPNVSGERTNVNPEPPKQTQAKPSSPVHSPETVESIHDAIDHFEKTGELRGNDLSILIEEMGEAVWDAHENDLPFDYIYLAGDLGFARNLIDEIKHRFSRITDRNARQAGFVPDFSKDFVDWFKDKDGKAIVDPYMRKLFKQFLEVHKNRKSNLSHYTVDINSFSPAMQKQFIDENGIQDLFEKDQRTGNYVKKSEEQINAEQHRRYQAVALDLIELEKNGVDTGMHMYAIEKDVSETGSLDEENSSGALKQQAWQQYRTTAGDIAEAQKKGSMPTKEELEQLVKRRDMGKRNRPRTGEIDDLVATAKKGSIVFSGIPTLEAFKILQKHLPLREIEAIAQIAPLVLDGGINKPNVMRIKYAGFEHAPEVGNVLKRGKDTWSATEKNMVFYSMELRATLRNINTGKFDYKRPHAHFLLHGVDIDVLQRRIQWMWKNEKETAKRWENYNDFERDVYRLIENYSMKSSVGGTRFFGGGAEGKAKKRLACAAIGAFPSKKMLGLIEGEDIEMDVPEIDWHHYQLRSYGKGNAGRDIPWTALRADGIKNVYGTNDVMRVPYAERAYYRAQELYQPASRKAVREGDDVPVNLRYVSQELQAGRAVQIFGTKRTSGGHVIPDYTPSGVLRSIIEGQFKQSPEKDRNLLEFVKGGIGHDEATNSALVFWHFSSTGKPFEKIEQGQIGLHIGTREAALDRAKSIAIGINVPPASIAENILPLVVSVKKPIVLLDRGAWSPSDVVDTILYAHLPIDKRITAPQPKVEGFFERGLLDEIVKQTGPLSSADIKFLTDYRSKLASDNINMTTAYMPQAEMKANKGVTPEFTSVSKRIYDASIPLHQWLKSKGIDAIKYRNGVEGHSWSYIIFDGKNVKNLTENSGQYSKRSISMYRQRAAVFGAENIEQAKNLESNYNQSVKEGDIFLSSAIKDNFIGNMPAHTSVIRQMADEAHSQGLSLSEYNKQFKTGSPVVFPAVHATDSQVVAVEGRFDPKAKLSFGKGVWWASHTEVAMTFKKDMPRDYVARALIKSENPLVVDAKGLKYSDKNLDVSRWINQASSDGHDSLILTNITDDVSLNTGEPLVHNQIVVFNEHANNNIAVIDNDVTSQRPVPRGLGINVGEAPLRQEASKDVKRTFYSAVEKLVEEKITDKTSLQELMGLLDPTKGTGIVKAELEFLDIAGWVDDQKKLAGSNPKAKVNKQALLDYIKAHKFELQEDKTNTAWYTLQGLDPNSPQVQSQVEGGYENFTPANKGYDDLHPTTNYRVLLLRGPVGSDYSGGEGGHFPEHQNIIAFARVGDIYLDRETEVPSPHPIAQAKHLEHFVHVDPDNHGGYHISMAENSISSFIKSSDIRTMDALRKMSEEDIFLKMLTAEPQAYTGGETTIGHDMISKLGFIFERLKDVLPPEQADALIDSVYELIEKHTDRDTNGAFDFLNKDRERELKEPRTPETRRNFYLFSVLEKIQKSIPESQISETGKEIENRDFYNGSSSTGRTTTIKRYESAVKDAIGILKSLLRNESELEIKYDSKKKKMLMVFETQSDNAQNMQGRNDTRLESVLTKSQLEEKKALEDKIKEVESRMDVRAKEMAVKNLSEYTHLITDMEKRIATAFSVYRNDPYTHMFDLWQERSDLRDELHKYMGRREVPVMSQKEFAKLPEVKAQLETAKKNYESWKKWDSSKDKLLEETSLIDEGLDYGTSSVNDMLGNDGEFGAIPDSIAGGKEKFIENLGVLVDRMLASLPSSRGDYSPATYEATTSALERIKKTIQEKGNVTSEQLVEINSIEQWGKQKHDKSRLPYYNYDYFLGLIQDYSQKNKELSKKSLIRRVGRLLHEEVTDVAFEDFFDANGTELNHYAGSFNVNDFSKETMYSIIDSAVDKYLAGDIKFNSSERKDTADIWASWKKHSLSDRSSHEYQQFREKVLHMLVEKMRTPEMRRPSRFTESELQSRVLSSLSSDKDIVVTETMPFLRTEDFSKLMFKKLLREALDNGYEGIILIPPELPQKITGGDSQYYYSTIYPKVINNYSKKFGAKLRENKSLSMSATDGEANQMVRILRFGLQGIKQETGKNTLEAREHLKGMAMTVLQLDMTNQSSDLYKQMHEKVSEKLANNSGMSIENGRKLLDYAIQSIRGQLSAEYKRIQYDHQTNDFEVSSSIGNPSKSASQRGLILDITPQMDAIKEGQPLWQPASRKPKRTASGEPAPETVADVRGESAPPVPKKKDRSVGEREAGSDIPEIGNKGIVDSYGTDLDQRLAKDGVADYRGYKIIYDKANGGYKMIDPTGKAVFYPVAYVDKITGQQVIKNNRHVVFPYEAAEYIDHILGGMPEKKPIQTPALPKPASVESPAMVNKPQPVSTPTQAGGRSELEIVQSQLDKSGKSKYYLYNIEYDPKTKTYSAKDNSGQPVQMMFPSTFQSGERFLQSTRHPSLELVLQGLDKKFDKNKWSRLAPKDTEAVASKPAPASVAPVKPPEAPVTKPEPTPAPEPKPTPTRRVESSSVPPAVREAKPTKPIKPKRQPKDIPNVNTPQPQVEQPQPVQVIPQTAEVKPPVVEVKPQPVEVTPDAWEQANKENGDKPKVVLSDKEIMELQAMALGKGFISMMKDPNLAQMIIESLNRDDNLTLKGTKDSANTTDGRFSVERKGKKYVITQNNYKSPITGIVYDRRILAYVNNIHQAQILIRRIELERSWSFAENRMPVENPLLVIAQQNPAYKEPSRMQQIRDNAMIQMLMSMRDQGITPIHIDPETLQPLLVMLPSEQTIAQVTKPKKPIAGYLPEKSTIERSLPLAIIDQASIFRAIDDVVIKGLSQQTREQASRFRNALGYEIIKFKGKFRLFNPMKGAISVREDEDSIMNDIIKDIHKNGLRR